MKAISGKDMARILKRHGWVLKRIRSSHHTFEKEGLSVTVPIHGNTTLKKGLQHGLMKT